MSVEPTGSDLDANGFLVVVGTEPARPLGALGTVTSFYVPPGTYGVTLEGIADNCTLQGSNPRSVSVEAGAIADVKFEIVCVATGIGVTTRTTGVDVPKALTVTVSGQPVVSVPSNGSQTVGRLTAGSYTVTLSVPPNCTISGDGQALVTVAARTVTPVSFDVACVAAVRLEKIAYVDVGGLNESGPGKLTLVNVDGTTPLVLGVCWFGGSSGSCMGDAPAWSPDGRLLAYSTTYCSSYYVYYWACGGRIALLDPETGNDSAAAGGRTGFNPAWSPSGATIAFDFYPGSRYDSSSGKALWVLGLSPVSITTLSIAGPQSSSQPTWSPDGERIAFVCRWTPDTDLCIVDADGESLVRLTNDALLDVHPKWSPDGRTIAYARHTGGRTDPASGEIVLIDVVTRQLTVLTTGTDPAWSRDGSRLVFAGADGLFVIGADGANRARLTTGSHRAPAWRP